MLSICLCVDAWRAYVRVSYVYKGIYSQTKAYLLMFLGTFVITSVLIFGKVGLILYFDLFLGFSEC